MSIFSIHHITKYEYDRPVKESLNSIKIYPYTCAEQETLQHELIITDQPDVHTFTDYWGNKEGIFNLLSPHRSLTIESKLLIKTLASQDILFPKESYIHELDNYIGNDLHLLELARASPVKAQALMDEYITKLAPSNKSIAAIIADTCSFIFEHFTYIKGITTIETTVDEILEKQAGVCQDFAHVMLELLRMMGIPSRYVSGYICPNKNGMRGEGATHAWVEAFLPHKGWIGIDPTNNVWVSNNHIKLAVGRNFSNCTPVKGTFKGPARQSLSVYVSVGYEDGVTFEELTSVQLENKFDNEVEEVIIDTFVVQQQQ
jgi:transglutaminase-like putative cysteine protease